MSLCVKCQNLECNCDDIVCTNIVLLPKFPYSFVGAVSRTPAHVYFSHRLLERVVRVNVSACRHVVGFHVNGVVGMCLVNQINLFTINMTDSFWSASRPNHSTWMM